MAPPQPDRRSSNCTGRTGRSTDWPTAVVLSNVAATPRWGGPAALALTGAALLVIGGGSYLLNRTANAVARLTGSTRLPWLTYSGALLSAWAAAAAVLLIGVQFSTPAGSGTAAFTIGAATAAAGCAVILLATVIVWTSALVNARALGTSLERGSAA